MSAGSDELKPSSPARSRAGPAASRGALSRQGIYSWYVVSLCFLIYALNFLGRQIINILGQPIKVDLGLSDTELGLLSGTAFGLFYSALGLPIARLADRMHRVNIISVSLLIWTSLTASCAGVATYLQLFLLRVGVGIGEAGGTPPSQSLISDYIPEEHRTVAFALFNAGPALGGFLAYMIGGGVGQTLGWRWAFVISALPGLAMVPLFKLTVKEPVRGGIDGLERESQQILPMRETVRALLYRPSYVWLITGSSFGIFSVYVTGVWLPPLFIRIHGFALHQIGNWMALSAILGGLLGSLGGGALASRLRRRWPRGDIWLVVVASALACPLLIITVLAGNSAVALSAMLVFSILVWVWIAPTSARIQAVVPVRARALAVGFMLFISNITALAFGPPLIGMASDALRPALGDRGLAVALAWASLAGLCTAACYVLAARYLLKDIQRTERPLDRRLRLS